MIAPKAGLSVTRQCALLGIARSSFYYRPRPESAEGGVIITTPAVRRVSSDPRHPR